MGGELWAVESPFQKTCVMICGIDVYHDTSKEKTSVAAFVASTNRLFTRWYSTTSKSKDKNPVEICNGLRISMLKSLQFFQNVNGRLPDMIVIFRDGVGDGQLETSSGHEVKQIAQAFEHFQNYEPKLSVVIVQKRISTRLFQSIGSNNRCSLENPSPGTVVDHTITRRNYYDFFLISQHVRQGTVSPTHYIVIHDDSGLTPDQMQKLSYKMTHLYYNWPGTIRVPAPCQYAHKLAQQVGQNIHTEPSEKLSDRLFYL